MRKVKNAAFGMVLAVSMAVVLGAPAAQAQSHKITEVEALSIQDQFFKAMISQDAQAMASLSSDDLVYIHLSGLRQTRAEFLSWVANRSFKKFVLLDHNVHIYDDAFVLNGLVEDTGGRHLLLTTVWEHKPAGWQMVLLQYTGVPKPKASAAPAH